MTAHDTALSHGARPVTPEAEPERPKFCKDCRWLEPTSHRCNHESAETLDLVSGEPRHFSAGLQRQSILDGDCGPSGRFWEPKP